MDIGGGSTELIVGEKFETQSLTSLKMGCVSLSRACFDDGRISESCLREAELLVRLKLEPVCEEFRALGWQVATGASGSIKAIHEVIMKEGWSREGSPWRPCAVCAALLESGQTAALTARWQLNRPAPACSPAIRGAAWLVRGAGREPNGGVRRRIAGRGHYDLLGRIRHEDVRDRTIAAVIDRYGLDRAQAERVNATAQALLNQVRDRWGLTAEEWMHNLDWAARLHEIGLLLTHDLHHKHGAYILQHAELPGFSNSDQTLLAALVRRHRRGFSAARSSICPGGGAAGPAFGRVAAVGGGAASQP